MAGYIGATPVPQATQHREAFTATANQVSFATAGYTPQFIDIYLNGVKLAPSDYVATNGSDIVLATGAATGDILEYVAYTPFEVADQTFTGTTTLTDSGAAPLVVNRTTSDGDITTFQKNGTTVGATGTDTTFGDFYVESKITNHAGLGFKVNEVLPQRNGYVDGIDNLGSSTYRFNNLYLSGGVYLGGTGAANKLDDYEEGTFTPTLSNGASGGSYSRQFGFYTKVGNTVFFSLDLLPTGWTANTIHLNIGGLPFNSVGTDGYFGGAFINYQAQFLTDASTGGTSLHVPANNNVIGFFQSSGNNFAGNQALSVNKRIIITGRYATT
jgi:hypothetical protein